jgi:uncharacterized protein (TIGR02145 family)
MTKTTVLLVLAFIVMSAASVNAQVRIGGDVDPNESAILDLNADDNVTNSGNLGLALPRVALVSTASFAPLKAHVNGMIVYNIATDGDVTPGTYYNDGSKWVRLGNGTSTTSEGSLTITGPIITTQPKSFSWSRMKDTNGDPNSTVTSFSPTLTVTASGEDLSYKWYKKAVNRNAADTLIATATTDSYTPTLSAWGMNSYYCAVSNAYSSVISNIADVAAGCGAKTVDGGWLKFMCHNLGASPLTATQSLDAITFGSGTAAVDSTSSDAKGWLFQWGRAADGHQWRGRTAYSTEGAVALSHANQVASGATTYGLFIKVTANPYDWRTPQYDYLWRNWNDGRFPCPSGWKVPSSSDWGALYCSGSTYGAPSQATANTWYWENNGYAIRPDGVTTTLFLPVAGSRSSSSAALNPVSHGGYWSSTTASSGASHLDFTASRVCPDMNDYRAFGISVRCVTE